MSSRNSKTEVYFSFDTEDFTHEKAWDAQRREAELLGRYGIRGNFNIVGYVENTIRAFRSSLFEHKLQSDISGR